MKNKISNGVKKLIPLSLYFLPFAVMAQASGSVEGAISRISGILTSIIPLLMIIATIVFLWGVIRYITSAGDEDKVEEQVKQTGLFAENDSQIAQILAHTVITPSYFFVKNLQSGRTFLLHLRRVGFCLCR